MLLTLQWIVYLFPHCQKLMLRFNCIVCATFTETAERQLLNLNYL